MADPENVLKTLFEVLGHDPVPAAKKLYKTGKTALDIVTAEPPKPPPKTAMDIVGSGVPKPAAPPPAPPAPQPAITPPPKPSTVGPSGIDWAKPQPSQVAAAYKTPTYGETGQLGGQPSYLAPQAPPLSKPTYPYQPLKPMQQAKPAPQPAPALPPVDLSGVNLPKLAGITEKAIPFELEKRANALGLNLPAVHATIHDFSEFKFNEDIPGTLPDIGIHFGTLKAGLDRLTTKVAGLSVPRLQREFQTGEGLTKDPSGLALTKPGAVWKVIPAQIGIKKPLELPDLGTWGPQNVAGALEYKYPGVFSKAETGKALASDNEAEQIKALRKLIQSKGYDGIAYKNKVEDPGSTSYILLDNTKARSFYAKFDPAKSKSANIGYALAGMSLVPLGLYESMGKAQAAEGQPKPKTAMDIVQGGVKPPDQPKTAMDIVGAPVAPKEEPLPQKDTSTLLGPGEVKKSLQAAMAPETVKGALTTAKETLGTIDKSVKIFTTEEQAHKDWEQMKKDVPAVASEGYQQAKESFGKALDRFSPENWKRYTDYIERLDRWEKLGALEKEVVPKPERPVGTIAEDTMGPAIIWDVLNGTGGAAKAIAALGIGAFRTKVSRPLEEAGVMKKETAEDIASLFIPTGIGFLTKVPQATRASRIGNFVGHEWNKIFQPEKIGAGERAAIVHSAAYGTAARDTEITRKAFDEFDTQVRSLSDADKMQLNAYIEGRSKGVQLADPTLQGAADAQREAVQLRRTKLENLPSTSQMNFVEDYLSHMYKDPNKFKQWHQGVWIPKQGSGAALKKRTIPTLSDAIAAGHDPITLNPMDMTMIYVENMDRFIAENAKFDIGRATGDIKLFLNHGKAGQTPFNPAAEKLGLKPLDGRLSSKKTPAGEMVAFADQDYARVYNRSVGRGYYGVKGDLGPAIGDLYSKANRASNALTASELGLSGYHFRNVAQESIVSDMANAIAQAAAIPHALKAGDLQGVRKLLAGSAWSALKQPAAFALKPFRGHKGQAIYLDRTGAVGSQKNRELIDLLERAGGRAIGFRHAKDYEMTAGHSYLQSFKKLSDVLNSQAYKRLGRTIVEDWAPGRVLPAPLAFFARQVGKAFQTISEPLFKHYIPKMKTGAFMDNMEAWLNANPGASRKEQIDIARKIWNSIDNRMGEMVQDNIFWPKMLQQTMQVGMRSFSYNLGTIREIGGGALTALAHPKSIGIRGTEYDPRSAYVFALPMVAGMMGMMYQYMKTGKPPESLDDAFHPRTGGMVPGVGGQGQVEERATLPSYMKDVFGWMDDAQQEAYNKLSAGASSIWEIGTNTTGPSYAPKKIVGPDESPPQWLADYARYAEKFLPISVRQMQKGQKKGSKLTGDMADMIFGPTSAGSQFTDPEGVQKAKLRAKQRYLRSQKYEQVKEKRVYGAPE